MSHLVDLTMNPRFRIFIFAFRVTWSALLGSLNFGGTFNYQMRAFLHRLLGSRLSLVFLVFLTSFATVYAQWSFSWNYSY